MHASKLIYFRSNFGNDFNDEFPYHVEIRRLVSI